MALASVLGIWAAASLLTPPPPSALSLGPTGISGRWPEADNPARPQERALELSCALGLVSGNHQPSASAPAGYDQRLSVDMGSRESFLPTLRWTDRLADWSVNIALERVRPINTAWDLFALPPGYNENLSDPGLDWRTQLEATSFTAGFGRKLFAELRGGLGFRVERWHVESAGVLAAPTGLGAPLSSIYGELSSQGTSTGLTGLQAGLSLRIRDRLWFGVNLVQGLDTELVGEARLRTWVPSALQWTEALPSEVDEGGVWRQRLERPLDLRMRCDYQPSARGTLGLWLGWRESWTLRDQTQLDSDLLGLTEPAMDARWVSSWRGGAELMWRWQTLVLRGGVVVDDHSLEALDPRLPEQVIEAALYARVGWRLNQHQQVQIAHRRSGTMRRESHLDTPGELRLGNQSWAVVWTWMPEASS